MTNYDKFPYWRKYGIVMKFGEFQYSWCSNTFSNRKYLIESAYCEGVIEFYVWENSTKYTNIDDFKKYLIKKQEN